MSPNQKIVAGIAIAAVLVALGAGLAYILTDSPSAFRILWVAGPIALTMAGFVLLQALLPREDGRK